MTPPSDRFLELYDGAYGMSWFIGPFADVAAAQAWWTSASDGAVCHAARDHDAECRARWHCAPVALSDAEARQQGLCDDPAGNLWTRIDPCTPPTVLALEHAIGEIVNGDGDDWRFDAATWEDWLPDMTCEQVMQQAAYLASVVQYHHAYQQDTGAAPAPPFPQVLTEALYTALVALHLPPQPGREYWLREVLLSYPPGPTRPQLSATLIAGLTMPLSTPVDAAFYPLVAGIQALVPPRRAGDGALERRPQLAGPAVVARLTALLDHMHDEVRLTRCPNPWTEAEVVDRLAQLARWPGQRPRRFCDLCSGQVVETAWLIALVAEGDRPELRALLAQIPHTVCLRCGLAEVALPPHASAPRWHHMTHDPPAFAAAVLAQVAQVAELAYELDGRGWMLAVRGVWYALTGASETALQRWRGSLSAAYGGGTTVPSA